MSRAIKFRAWDEANREMVTTENLVVGFDGRIRHLAASEASMAHLKLMQFTGLLDKSGVEIYEGDIVKQVYTAEEIAENTDVVCIICIAWNPEIAGFSFVEEGVLFNDSFDDDCAKAGEVIGNIYENPELLEPSK